jgi:hypothetical protein
MPDSFVNKFTLNERLQILKNDRDCSVWNYNVDIDGNINNVMIVKILLMFSNEKYSAAPIDPKTFFSLSKQEQETIQNLLETKNIMLSPATKGSLLPQSF